MLEEYTEYRISTPTYGDRPRDLGEDIPVGSLCTEWSPDGDRPRDLGEDIPVGSLCTEWSPDGAGYVHLPTLMKQRPDIGGLLEQSKRGRRHQWIITLEYSCAIIPLK